MVRAGPNIGYAKGVSAIVQVVIILLKIIIFSVIFGISQKAEFSRMSLAFFKVLLCHRHAHTVP